GEMYITKEELIQYLNDHEINSIRIVAETKGQLKVKKSRKMKAKSVPCISTMIDIVSTGKKEENPIIYYEWETDSTIDYSKIIDVQDEKEEGVKKD
ncbi:MAG: hypothetical protein ACOC5T_07810, partial [Elusimicrobiota bacterium]